MIVPVSYRIHTIKVLVLSCTYTASLDLAKEPRHGRPAVAAPRPGGRKSEHVFAVGGAIDAGCSFVVGP